MHVASIHVRLELWLRTASLSHTWPSASSIRISVDAFSYMPGSPEGTLATHEMVVPNLITAHCASSISTSDVVNALPSSSIPLVPNPRPGLHARAC